MTDTSGMGGMKHDHPEGCHCMACKGGAWCGTGRSCCHGGWWMVVRIVIMLLIIAGAFAAGVKAGEFKERFGNRGYGASYGPGMMNRQGGFDTRGYGMMGSGYNQLPL